MKRKNIYLSLAIACLLGIIAIFVFGGYLGMYDTFYVTSGEYEQEIGPEYWHGQRPGYSYPFSVGVRWGDTVRFRYEIDNRLFSGYLAQVKASLWKSNEKIKDLLDEDVSLASFDKSVFEWTLTGEDMAKLSIGQYTVKINRGDVEVGKGIVINFYQEGQGYPVKPIPAPTIQ